MIARFLAQLPIQEFYENLLGRKLNVQHQQAKIECPFHLQRVGYEDAEASLIVSLEEEKGGIYQCFGCGARGNAVHFYQQYKKGAPTDFNGAIKEICKLLDLDPAEFTREAVPTESITQWTTALFETDSGKAELQKLIETRGISESVIRKYKLGWAEEKRRITIPIPNSAGDFVNVKFWLPPHHRKTKRDHAVKNIMVRGATTKILFPVDQLSHEKIYVVEGEMDCLVMISHGFITVTNLTGVNAWTEQLAKFFTNKEVVIIFDDDKPAEGQTANLADFLKKFTRSTKILSLSKINPGKTNQGFDITDAAIHYGDKFREVILQLEEDSIPITLSDTNGNYFKTNMFEATSSYLINRKVEFKARVASKEMTPFGIPKCVRMQCTGSRNPCQNCPRLKDPNKAYFEATFDKDDVRLVGLVSSNPVDQKEALYKLFQVGEKRGCNAVFEPVDYSNLEEILIMPDLDEDYDPSNWEVRTAYYAGRGLIPNQTYQFKGTTSIYPRNNVVTHVFGDAQVTGKFTDEIKPDSIVNVDDKELSQFEALMQFQPVANQTVAEKLAEIYDDFQYNVTGIYHRQLVHEAVDLTYHSPIHLQFGKTTIYKGWIDTLIFGDTQCGKSQTAEFLKDHFRLGRLINAETASRVGLTGGFIKAGNRDQAKYMLGLMPLHDKQLIIIDEAAGMSTQQWGELTHIRGSGKAISTKQAQHYESPAHCRLVVISNPREGREMRSFRYGCSAVKTLIGDDADIARFDIVVAVNVDDVSVHDVLQGPLSVGDVPHVYTSDLCSLLLQWVWSRSRTNYQFTQEAVEATLHLAEEMASKYDPSIPIVAPNSQKNVIAKIAAAVACRLFSTTNGIDVNVELEHVQYAHEFLTRCYTSPSMGYDTFSGIKKQEAVIPFPSETTDYLSNLSVTVVQFLKHQNGFSREDFIELCGLDLPSEASMVLRTLVVNLRCLTKSKTGYYATKGFNQFLSKYEHPDDDSKAHLPKGLSPKKRDVEEPDIE